MMSGCPCGPGVASGHGGVRRVQPASVAVRVERRDEAVHLPVVVGRHRRLVPVRPALIDVVRVVVRVRAATVRGRLAHRRLPVLHRDAVGARVGPEVLIERAVLHHDEHEVVDVVDPFRRVDRRAVVVGGRCGGGLSERAEVDTLRRGRRVGGSAPSGQVGTSVPPPVEPTSGLVSVRRRVVSVPGEPVVQATAITPTRTRTATTRPPDPTETRGKHAGDRSRDWREPRGARSRHQRDVRVRVRVRVQDQRRDRLLREVELLRKVAEMRHLLPNAWAADLATLRSARPDAGHQEPVLDQLEVRVERQQSGRRCRWTRSTHGLITRPGTRSP